MARYSKKNPAPRRCATCKHCTPTFGTDGVCSAPLPAWIVEEFEGELNGDKSGIVQLDDPRDPKCPLWEARGPTTH